MTSSGCHRSESLKLMLHIPRNKIIPSCIYFFVFFFFCSQIDSCTGRHENFKRTKKLAAESSNQINQQLVRAQTPETCTGEVAPEISPSLYSGSNTIVPASPSPNHYDVTIPSTMTSLTPLHATVLPVAGNVARGNDTCQIPVQNKTVVSSNTPLVLYCRARHMLSFNGVMNFLLMASWIFL